MLAAIFEQTNEDCQLFESFIRGNVCDPLSTSSYLSYRAAQGWNTWQSHGEVPFAKQNAEAELFHLRGLTIRSIVRGLSTGFLDDELDGAIRAFALAERMLFPDNSKIHDAVLQYLDTERCYRLQEVLSALRGALDQWSPVSSIMLKVRDSTSTKSSQRVIRNSNPRNRYLLESHSPDVDCQSVPRVPQKLSSPALSSAKDVMVDRNHTNENWALLTVLAKRKRKSDEGANNRSKKQKLCPIDACGKRVLQRVLARNLKQVHGQGEIYECDEDFCEKVFL
jgi:hypothetical protein